MAIANNGQHILTTSRWKDLCAWLLLFILLTLHVLDCLNKFRIQDGWDEISSYLIYLTWKSYHWCQQYQSVCDNSLTIINVTQLETQYFASNNDRLYILSAHSFIGFTASISITYNWVNIWDQNLQATEKSLYNILPRFNSWLTRFGSSHYV